MFYRLEYFQFSDISLVQVEISRPMMLVNTYFYYSIPPTFFFSSFSSTEIKGMNPLKLTTELSFMLDPCIGKVCSIIVHQ